MSNQNQNNNNQNNQNQNNNNNQGGLLNRINNNNQNQNNQNQNNNNQNNQNQNNSNQNNNSFRSRFGNNRFGNNNLPAKPSWTITPLGDGVKIAYQGVGDPLFRILGTTLDTSMTEIEAFATKLAEDDAIRNELIEKLDDAWETYGITGAILLHPVRKNIYDAFTSATLPVVETEDQQPDSNNNLPGRRPAPTVTKAPYQSYRAVDATFVLNILGRVRGNVLVDETPIALESGFLNQAYICDDPRIVEMAIATGAIEEVWQ